MNVALFDHPQIWHQLLPLTYTRPVAEIRLGILTISEKWQQHLDQPVKQITQDYLAKKFPWPETHENLLVINGGICPDIEFVNALNSIETDKGLQKDGMLLAARLSTYTNIDDLLATPAIEYHGDLTLISRPWHIFKEAGAQIRQDYQMVTNQRQSAPINDKHTIVYQPQNIFIEAGVSIKAAILNAEDGPIYLGKGTSVEEGAVIRGPFALGEDSTINAQARMRGDIAIGPKCKVGGEVSNSVIFGFTNKGHDGFLGNSVLGEWCNIGAGTNTSNLKNNYTKVKVWDYNENKFINSGEQFCGLMMGDHSKCGINTMFNTGTIAGVAANIFGAGFPRTLIPSFSWGGHAGFTTFRPEKVKEMATVSMRRRDGIFDEEEEKIMNYLFTETKKYRTWEK
jgi:UDP-N-acetylglucosamine diphosphorylase/glucosamine-1-phosphate N-acetyltransferase